MPTVSNTVLDPSGTPVNNAAIVVRLVASSTGMAPGFRPDDSAILGEWGTRTDVAGLWSVTLDANSTLTPVGTYYTVTETVSGRIAVTSFIVPAGAGPHNLADIVVLSPDAPDPTGVTYAAMVTYVASQGGGGGGAVTSVFGRTGAVTGAKADVGLANVDNTSDANKPVSTAQGLADAAVQSFAIQRANHTGTQSADTLTDGTTNKAFLATERTKLTGIATGATANSSDATLLARANHTGTQSADTLTDGTTNKAFLATERTKLAGIATAATANSSDATLLARANHTGTQTLSTISNAGTAAALNVPASGDAAVGEVVKGSDTRLTNARTPSAHAASHASGGGDPVTLAESQVTNLVNDLAAKAPVASPTFTGTPAAPTAAPGTNTTQVATTAFVAAAAGGGTAGAGIAAFCGNGADGNVTISTTVTAVRDMYYNDLTIGASGILHMRGYRLHVKGTLTVASGGIVSGDGYDGQANGNFTSAGTFTTGACGAGGTGATGVGGGGAASNNVAAASAVLGGAGGLGSSGAGGAGATANTYNPLAHAGPSAAPQCMTGNFIITADNTTRSYGGGAGGGAGGGDGTNKGAAGGNGGYVLVVNARAVVNDGAIRSKGGVGGTPTTGNAGGGGGGTGGTVFLNAGSLSGAGTVTAPGGAGGSGVGTGSAGSSGAAGNVYSTVWS